MASSNACKIKKCSAKKINKSSISKGRYVIAKSSGRSLAKNKGVEVRIYPMLPKGFTASQRKALKAYEKSLYSGKKLDWNF